MKPAVQATRLAFLVSGLWILAAGCTTEGDVGDAPDADRSVATDPMTAGDHADMGHMAHEASELSASAGPGFTEADVHFMQMMIGHHDQAIRMADMAPDRDAGPEVLTLAERIDISQRDEIQFMRGWLEQRNQPLPEEHHLRAMVMPGLVTPENFERLEAARGAEFDRLFLTFMIDHHLGAIEMVDHLFDNPRAAQEPDIFRFANDVATDQFDEISVMERILTEIAPNSRSNSR